MLLSLLSPSQIPSICAQRVAVQSKGKRGFDMPFRSVTTATGHSRLAPAGSSSSAQSCLHGVFKSISGSDHSTVLPCFCLAGQDSPWALQLLL